MYIDGYERKDVIKYRVDFLNFIFEYEKSLAKYIGDDMEDVELSISTRENASFRNNIFRLGITSMSAGSKTNPGGYAVFPEKESLEQFEIDDKRSAKEIAEMLKQNGYEAVWKDWDKALM